MVKSGITFTTDLLIILTNMNAPIFLIDDDEDDRLLFREAIKSNGLEEHFSEFANSESFMEYMNGTAPSIPGLIFLDINMPATDGYTLLNKIRANQSFAEAPVVMLTTSNNPNDIKFAEQNLASGFAAKPYDYKKLEEIIHTAVKHFFTPKNAALFFTII